MELEIAGAKVSKWAVRESGDTLEMIERPHGGLSLVLVDGQHTGHGAKTVSNLVARKAISLLGEGVRDGAVARAAHDYLYLMHEGKVSAEMHILSFDLVSKTIVISRNSHCPVIIGHGCDLKLLEERSEPIGVHRRMKPLITEVPIIPQTTVAVFTDGALDAGVRYGGKFDIPEFLAMQLCDETISAQKLADAILARSVELDRGRPNDDTSVLVARVIARVTKDDARRISARFPIE